MSTYHVPGLGFLNNAGSAFPIDTLHAPQSDKLKHKAEHSGTLIITALRRQRQENL